MTQAKTARDRPPPGGRARGPALALAGLAAAASPVEAAPPAAPKAPRPVAFDAEVRPILSDRCFRCHGPDAKHRKAGLRLDTPEGLRADLDELVRRIATHDEDDRMPPPDAGAPLTEAQVAIVRRWIAEGARWQGHWAFQPVARPDPPPVRDARWPRNDVDRFVLARLEAEGLAPSAEADRATLLRRVSLDLTGLPPSPEEARAFAADRRPDAYERAVDRLLASPHYGERWGRHWLDLARYADSNGYSIDSPRAIWKYRDWVIAALNRDMPFPEFVIEQLAGDLLPEATVDQKIATGFHRNTMFNEEGGIDLEQFRVDAVADRVATTGAVFLGLTLGCARCHDHKYDPIAQKEFFQLFAFFNNADEPVLELGAPEEIARATAIRAQLRAVEKELGEYERRWVRGLPEERRKQIPTEIGVILALGTEQRDDRQWRALFDHLKLQDAGFRERIQTLEGLRARRPPYVTTLVMKERDRPRDTHVHLGGDFTRPGERVEPGVPQVLPPLEPSDGRPRRLDLARWLVDPRNPLTPRVTVNRIWQQHFGVGLVETENDFGTQGARPSHPELLDHLASALLAGGGRLKALHRLIVTSATYRQASRHRPDLAERDPANRLLGRQSRLRLEAEAIRDAALAASGRLDRRLGGPPVFPPQPDGVFGFTQIPRVWNASTGRDRHRRALYTHLWRSAPHPALVVFDAPDGQQTCTRRNRSTTPLQALTLLNDPAFVELALGRAPAPREAQRLAGFVASQRASLAREAGAAGADAASWTALARVLLNLDEFITRE